jgi:Tol biopolymer transport system component
MTDDRSLERAARSWIEAGPSRAPDHVVEAALLSIQTTSQERGLRAPWRPDTMPTIARVAAAAAIGVLVVGGAFLFLQRPGQPSVGVSPSSSPSSAPTGSPAAAMPPFGLALIDTEGNVQDDLRMPLDAWFADLSVDGRVAFLTRSQELGNCGGCGREWRIAIVDTASGASGYVVGNDHDAVRDLAWSPDGTRLAFTNDDGTGNLDIYVLDNIELANDDLGFAGDIRRLTIDPATDEFPAWTPDGAAILYDNAGAEPLDDSGFSPTQEIWKVSADGGDPVRLTTNDAWDSMPDVAPDGTVVFARGDGVWTMGLDGTDQRRLDKLSGGLNPRWSPDGSRLALLEYDPSERALIPAELGRGTNYPLLRVLVVDVASGELTNTGQRVPSDVNPASWTADGTGLLIYRYDDGG